MALANASCVEEVVAGVEGGGRVEVIVEMGAEEIVEVEEERGRVEVLFSVEEENEEEEMMEEDETTEVVQLEEAEAEADDDKPVWLAEEAAALLTADGDEAVVVALRSAPWSAHPSLSYESGSRQLTQQAPPRPLHQQSAQPDNCSTYPPHAGWAPRPATAGTSRGRRLARSRCQEGGRCRHLGRCRSRSRTAREGRVSGVSLEETEEDARCRARSMRSLAVSVRGDCQ